MELERHHCIVGLIVCVLLLSVVTPTMEIQSDFVQSIDDDEWVTPSSYTPHGNIDIIGDAELAAASVSGTGWGFDPYILEGWSISTSDQHGIRIRDTTAHFVIRDCWITTNSLYNWRAIWIENATIGTVTIYDNICFGSILGIDIDDCLNVSLLNNQCNENHYGIMLDDCDGSILVNNTCDYSMTYGIRIDSSPYCNLTDNRCSYTNWNSIHGTSHGMGRGIDVVSSPHTVIHNSTCSNNEYDGIRVYQSSYSVLRLNNVTGGHYFGIYVGSSHDSVVSNNTVTDTTDIGIYTTESDSVIVASNTAKRNEQGGIYVTHCAPATVVDNTMLDDGLSLYGSTIADYESMTVSGNSINNKPFGFFLNSVDDIISTDYGQLLLVNCSNALVIWQNCSFTSMGVELKWCNGCGVVFSSFNHNDNTGIRISWSNHTSISYTTCSDNRMSGCHLEYTYNTSVIENTISNSRFGILLDSHNLTHIENNTISGSSDYGLYYNLVGDISIEGNEFWSDGIYFPPGADRQDYLDYNQTLNNNLVNGVPLAILFDLHHQTITEKYGQLVLVDALWVDIIDKDYDDTVTGLTLISSSHCRIIHTDVSSCTKFGILAESVYNTTIDGCNCTLAGTEGIRVDNSNEDVVINNQCSDSYYGMRIDSNDAQIESNICQYTEAGILVGDCVSPVVTDNDCSYNRGTGIILSGTTNPIIEDNLCVFNEHAGISLSNNIGAFVKRNNCSFNEFDGMTIFASESCIIVDNFISTNYHGLRLDSMSQQLSTCQIVQNYILHNSEHGIYVDEGEYFEIRRNFIAHNQKYGVYISRGTNIRVHHCYFLDNNDGLVQAYDGQSDQSEWYDLPSLEGNFWSDHISYSAYNIDGSTGAVDLFPFVVPDLDDDNLDDTWEIENGLNPLTADSDNDLIPDNYEVENGLDPTSDDSQGDADGDTLTNLFEYQHGLMANNIDSDSDLMDDFWEWTNNLDPLFDDSSADYDADALMNIDEYNHGTDPQSSDSDMDSMTDGFEVLYGLNPLVDDAAEDNDSDTLTNLQEFLLGLNPSSEDSDQDLMDDAWEVHHYLNPLLDDAGWDPDGDGATNYEEYLAGTNPLVPNGLGGTSPLMAAALIGLGVAGGVIATVVLVRWRAPKPKK